MHVRGRHRSEGREKKGGGGGGWGGMKIREIKNIRDKSNDGGGYEGRDQREGSA